MRGSLPWTPEQLRRDKLPRRIRPSEPAARGARRGWSGGPGPAAATRGGGRSTASHPSPTVASSSCTLKLRVGHPPCTAHAGPEGCRCRPSRLSMPTSVTMEQGSRFSRAGRAGRAEGLHPVRISVRHSEGEGRRGPSRQQVRGPRLARGRRESPQAGSMLAAEGCTGRG